jgi:hypothetical protein
MQAFAAEAPAQPTVDAVVALIQQAVAAASDAPGFAALSAADKQAALEAAVEGAIAASGATDPALLQAVLAQAVGAGVISGTVAVAAAASVSAPLAQAVAANPTVQLALTAQGVTAAIAPPAAGGANNALVVFTNTQTGAGGAVTGGATFNPCAGVQADYC